MPAFTRPISKEKEEKMKIVDQVDYFETLGDILSVAKQEKEIEIIVDTMQGKIKLYFTKRECEKIREEINKWERQGEQK